MTSSGPWQSPPPPDEHSGQPVGGEPGTPPLTPPGAPAPAGGVLPPSGDDAPGGSRPAGEPRAGRRRANRPPAWTPPDRTAGAGPGGSPGSPSSGPNPSGPNPSGTEPAGPPPEDIRAAWGLWLAAAAFALIGMLVNSVTTRFADLPVATRDTFRDAVESAGDTGGATAEDIFAIALSIGAVLALIAAAVTVWLAFRLRAGKGWARPLLDIVAIFLVIDAVAVVIGVFGGVAVAGQRGEIVAFVVFSLQILAGLCAATAAWRQHTAESTAFTLRGGGARAGH